MEGIGPDFIVKKGSVPLVELIRTAGCGYRIVPITVRVMTREQRMGSTLILHTTSVRYGGRSYSLSEVYGFEEADAKGGDDYEEDLPDPDSRLPLQIAVWSSTWDAYIVR